MSKDQAARGSLGRSAPGLTIRWLKMSEVGVVETPSARRASVRRAAFAAAAGVLVVGLGFPAIVEAIATSQLDQLMTLSALAVGMAAGGFLLASVIGYAASVVRAGPLLACGNRVMSAFTG